MMMMMRVVLLVGFLLVGEGLQCGVVHRRSTVTMIKATKKQMRLRYPKGGKLDFVLTKDASPWGKEGDVLRVTRGFALNYLSPKRLAVPASGAVVAEFEAKKAALEAERLAAIEAAMGTAGALTMIGRFRIAKKIGPSGDLFGSVDKNDILQVVSQAAGVDLDGSKVTMPSKDMDKLGDYTFSIQLHPEVTIDLTISLVEG